MNRTISNPQLELNRLLDWFKPDALWVEVELHSDQAATVWILDADDTYTEWLASLSLDDRWTLSPRGGIWENRVLTL